MSLSRGRSQSFVWRASLTPLLPLSSVAMESSTLLLLLLLLLSTTAAMQSNRNSHTLPTKPVAVHIPMPADLRPKHPNPLRLIPQNNSRCKTGVSAQRKNKPQAPFPLGVVATVASIPNAKKTININNTTCRNRYAYKVPTLPAPAPLQNAPFFRAQARK